MKSKDNQYKNKSVKDLTKDATQLREEIAKLTLERGSTTQKDTNLIHKKKKSLAIVLSFLTQKKEIEKLEKEIKIQ